MRNQYIRLFGAGIACLTLLAACENADGLHLDVTPTPSEEARESDELSVAERTAIALLSQRISDLETRFSRWLPEDGSDVNELKSDEVATDDVRSGEPEPESEMERETPTPTDVPDLEPSLSPTNGEDKRETAVEPSYYSYIVENGEVTVTGWSGDGTGKVVVPAEIGGLPVCKLADSAFAQTNVTVVQLPETLREIGWFAFYQCNRLKSVEIPSGVETIGYATFDGCSGELQLVVEKNTYAEQYALSFALPIQYK